jgi:hypothetical protein
LAAPGFFGTGRLPATALLAVASGASSAAESRDPAAISNRPHNTRLDRIARSPQLGSCSAILPEMGAQK